jgi:glycine/D-amino acid oxidase-like deaminating enzyme
MPNAARHDVAANFALSPHPRFGDPLVGRLPGSGLPTIAVVGAGYTGLAAALHLAERGGARVVLLEAGLVGCGPSGKSAGHVCGLQRPDEVVAAHCGPGLGQALIADAADAIRLVRDTVSRLGIECDLRDGYTTIHPDGGHETRRGGEFGLSPYRYVIGLARAAAEKGAAIHEWSPVLRIDRDGDGFELRTPSGSLRADCVIAAGGHKMAETIPALAHLRALTTEIRVTMLVSDPLPPPVTAAAMPSNPDRFPFADTAADVAYGSFLADGRLIFGTAARALRDPSPATIAARLSALLPTLAPAYAEEEGRRLETRPLVTAERICFTRDALPLVGSTGGGRLLYVSGLGGHGVAMGTALGRAAAGKARELAHLDGADGADIFDRFASIRHGWLPPYEPLRGLAAAVGMTAERLAAALLG